MKNKSKLLILKVVFESVFAISKTKLLNILSENHIGVSKRTLERYLKDLIDSFFIEFSVDKKGYVRNKLIDEKEATLYLQYLNVNMLTQNLINFSENSSKHQKYIISENIVFKGTVHIETILNAFEQHKELTFMYHKQYAEKEEREVIPLFLKEYQKRWYLIGLDKNRNTELRTFGLDRIENLKTHKTLEKIVDIDTYKQAFKGVIGLDLRPINPEYPNPIKVLIKAKAQQPYYFKSLPLHESQKIVKETKEYTLFEYEILINFEFTQHLNMYQPFLEVMEPEWLRNRMNKN
jgi:predicted DNA-binding transcriptional regulator YafY